MNNPNDSWGVKPVTAWSTVAILMLMTIASYMDRTIISLLVVPIQADLGISDFQISMLQGVAFGIFYALFGFPMGWLVDRYPRRWVLYFGVSAWSLASAACGLAQNYLHLLLARMGVGAAESVLSPAAYSLIADQFPRRRMALAMGVFATGSALGGAVALIVGGQLIQWFTELGNLQLPWIGTIRPWQAAFIVTGLPGLLIALLIFLVPEPVRRNLASTRDKVDEGDLRRFLSHNKAYLLPHFIGFGLLATLAYGMSAWFPVYLIREFKLSVAQAGLAAGTTSGLFGCLGFLFSGWVADFWFARGTRDAHFRYFVVGCPLILAAALIGFLFSNNLYLTLAMAAVTFFLTPFTAPAVAHLQMVTPPQMRGRVSALFVLTFNLFGLCLGPTAVAFLTDFVFHDPQRLGASLALLFALVIPVVFLLFFCNLTVFRRTIAGADEQSAASMRNTVGSGQLPRPITS